MIKTKTGKPFFYTYAVLAVALILLDPSKRKSTILVNEHLIAAVSFIFVYGTLFLSNFMQI